MKVEIAKNLLKGKTCDMCLHASDEFCTSPVRHGRRVEDGTRVLLPDENTCKEWVETWAIKYTSIPVTAKARKLNIKWTMESELEILRGGLGVDKEVIKAAEEEIDGDKKQ